MSTEPVRILVVDDDADVRFMLRRYLTRHDFEVEAVEDGKRMRQAMAAKDFDLVVLDLAMPGEDGLSLARFLRETTSVGIVMLTASAEITDRVVGLEVGADDYVTKPFEPRELLARIKSVLRRMRSTGRGRPAKPERVAFGGCKLDLGARKLFGADGAEIPITSMEYDLLKAFVDHPGKVLTRDQLLNLAHNRDWEPFDRSIDIRIARLRRKVEPDPANPRVIKTVRGAGYVYDPSGAD